MSIRSLSFGAGPARWPESVLVRAGEGLAPDPESGLSVLELSHRSATYSELQAETLECLKRLLDVPESHEVLLLPGGATSQFALLPLNLRRAGRSADYVVTGSWSKKALSHARASGEARVAASSEEGGFREFPAAGDWELDESAEYLHLTSNNTIAGTQLREFPSGGSAPLVVDASSDIVTRDIPFDRVAMAYAGAQKCLGPAGLAIVVIDRELLERAPESVPSMLRYRDHASAGSRLNTPPTALVWLTKLMLDWIEEEGGAEEMRRRAERRAEIVYGALDRNPEVFDPHAVEGSRSMTNVVFRIKDERASEEFLGIAASEGMSGLKGHRSVGGFRASMYTAMPLEGAERLSALLDRFAARCGAVGA